MTKQSTMRQHGIAKSSLHDVAIGVIYILMALVPAPVAAQSSAEIYQNVSPSIVTVFSAKRTMEGDPPRWVHRGDQGSGAIIDADGRILTAAHLVQSADQVIVEFHGGEQITARVVSSEPAYDIALLLPESMPQSSKPAVLGDSDQTRIGDVVEILAVPLNIAPTITVGHISGRIPAFSKKAPFFPAELLLTDAVIVKGSSGAAMFNADGALIGIVTHIIQKEGRPCGLGCAVAINTARNCLIDRPAFWSGLTGHFVAGETAKALHLPQTGGVLVQHVAAGSPAGDIGLRAGTHETVVGDVTLIVGGDIILSVDGVALTNFSAYQAARERARTLKGGESIDIGILRDGERLTLKYTMPADKK